MLMSFLSLLEYCAVVILIAFIVVWIVRWFTGKDIDANVFKWGKIVVGLILIIAVVGWLLGVVNVPNFNWRH